MDCDSAQISYPCHGNAAASTSIWWSSEKYSNAFPAGSEEPIPLHGEVHDLKQTDGTNIHAEFEPAGAPTLVRTLTMTGLDWTTGPDWPCWIVEATSRRYG